MGNVTGSEDYPQDVVEYEGDELEYENEELAEEHAIGELDEESKQDILDDQPSLGKKYKGTPKPKGRYLEKELTPNEEDEQDFGLKDKDNNYDDHGHSRGEEDHNHGHSHDPGHSHIHEEGQDDHHHGHSHSHEYESAENDDVHLHGHSHSHEYESAENDDVHHHGHSHNEEEAGEEHHGHSHDNGTCEHGHSHEKISVETPPNEQNARASYKEMYLESERRSPASILQQVSQTQSPPVPRVAEQDSSSKPIEAPILLDRQPAVVVVRDVRSELDPLHHLDEFVPPYRGSLAEDDRLSTSSSLAYSNPTYPHHDNDDGLSTSSFGSSSIRRNSAAKTPRSLWTQLLGADDSSSDDERQQTMTSKEELDDEELQDEDAKGIKLLGVHLANVKLAAEEEAHQFRQRIKKLEQDKLDQQQALREANERIVQLEEQVKTLEVQNTRKWQIESRDHWIHQVEVLKQERNRLRAENERMSKSLEELQGNPKDGSDPESLRNLLKEVLADLQAERGERQAMKKALEEANARVEIAEAEANAFKKKLDFELELKWERSRKTAVDDEQPDSILGIIGEVIAPRLA